MEHIIKVETQKKGYIYGSIGYLQGFFSRVTKLEIGDIASKEMPCIRLHWVDKSYGVETPKNALIAFYGHAQNDGYKDYGNGYYAVYPVAENKYMVGLFDFLTPQAEKVIEMFIDDCVNKLKDYINNNDENKEFSIIIN